MTTKKHGRLSTDERDQIAALAADGKTAMEIAIAMERNASTINNHLWCNKIPTNLKAARWTHDDDERLMAGVRRGLTDQAIGDLLNRSGNAVHARINYMGGRALLLYPAGPSIPLPLVAKEVDPPARTEDPYYLWSRANARLQARRNGHA